MSNDLIPPLAHDDIDICRAHYEAGRNQIIFKTFVSDTQTAIGAMMKLSRDMPYACLLESVEGGEIRGRYSIIAISPDLIWRSSGERSLKSTIIQIQIFMLLKFKRRKAS